MSERLQAQTTSGVQTLTNGGSLSVQLDTSGGTEITTLVDDGTGGTPATYDLRQEYRPDATAAWMPYDTVSGTTAHSFIDPATAGQWRVVLTNQSGASADFRVRVVAHGGQD